jgi:hypothetical protein
MSQFRLERSDFLFDLDHGLSDTFLSQIEPIVAAAYEFTKGALTLIDFIGSLSCGLKGSQSARMRHGIALPQRGLEWGQVWVF